MNLDGPDVVVTYDDTDTDIGLVRLVFEGHEPIILDDVTARDLVYDIEKVLRKIEANMEAQT